MGRERAGVQPYIRSQQCLYIFPILFCKTEYDEVENTRSKLFLFHGDRAVSPAPLGLCIPGPRCRRIPHELFSHPSLRKHPICILPTPPFSDQYLDSTFYASSLPKLTLENASIWGLVHRFAIIETYDNQDKSR